MRLLLDTNILLDVALRRQPFFADSSQLIPRAEALGFEMFVAWHGLATLFYLVSRQHDEAAAEQAVRDILSWATVATVGHSDAMHALGYSMSDYEDALQAASARAEGVALIITRDLADFAKSPVPSMSPADFLTKYGRP